MPKFNLIRDRFQARDNERSSKLDRARAHCRIVNPSLLPDEGFNQTSELPVPYSSSVTRFSTRLASKAAGAIIPVNGSPFFESAIPGIEPDDKDSTDIYKNLYQLENEVQALIFSSNLRGQLTSAMEHLITPGDVVVFMDDDFNFQIYRLDQFTIKRDGAGRWKELIVIDWIDVDLEDPAYGATNGGRPKLEANVNRANGSTLEPRYTMILWDQETNTYKKTVEFRDEVLEQFEGEYKEFLCPYMPLRWSSISNEDYARSLVEENIGDIRSAEALAKAFLEGASASAEGRVLVNPNGLTDARDLEESVNWQFVSGRPEDVTFLQADNNASLNTIFTTRQAIEQGLSTVFLADQIANLTGDRVTATQVRAIAANLEEALGGVFSLISREFQLPLIRRAMYLIVNDKTYTFLPEIKELVNKNLIDLRVRTGLDALGRELDAARVISTLDTLLRWPTEAQSVIKWDEAARELIRTQGIVAQWVRTKEEQAQIKAQELAQNVAPDLINNALQGQLNGTNGPNGPNTDGG